MTEELLTWMKTDFNVFFDNHRNDDKLKMRNQCIRTNHIPAFTLNNVVADQIHMLNLVIEQDISWN